MGGSGKKVKDPEKDKAKAAEKDKKDDQKKDKKKFVGKQGSQFTLIRVSGADLNGDKPVVRAIMGIKGLGFVLSKAICEVGGVDPMKKLSDFEESEIKKLEDVIKNPLKYGVPKFMVNRRRDMRTGEDMHMTGDDLTVSTKFDIQRYIDLKTYHGWRFMMGQPVRGQRTRSKFREKGRVVGVLRKGVTIAPKGGSAEKK